MVATALTGALIALLVPYALSPEFLSSAVLDIPAHDSIFPADTFVNSLWDECTSLRNLGELIQRFDLYPSDRDRLALESIDRMRRKDLGIEITRASIFRITFRYRDPAKAQALVQELTRQMVQRPWTGVRLISPANLPVAPEPPDRKLLALWGLGLGILAGTVAISMRWNAARTLKLIACGITGSAVVSSLALFIPDRYVSKATVRLRVSQEWLSAGFSENHATAEISRWLEVSRRDVLSNSSLLEIIQRPSLRLYGNDVTMDEIRRMRSDIKIEPVAPKRSNNVSRVFSIAFPYTDRLKAQAVVSALTTKITDAFSAARPANGFTLPRRYRSCAPVPFWDCSSNLLLQNPRFINVDLLDPATLPDSPNSPNRWIIALYGLAAGLWLGATTVRVP